MHAPYKPYHTRPHIPEMPVSPPELSDGEWERNNRNVMREDAIRAINTLASNLEELSDEHGNGLQNTLKDLAELKDYLNRDMED